MLRTHQTNPAAALEKAFEQWDHYNENGGNDPFYSDGYNMNNLR